MAIDLRASTVGTVVSNVFMLSALLNHVFVLFYHCYQMREHLKTIAIVIWLSVLYIITQIIHVAFLATVMLNDPHFMDCKQYQIMLPLFAASKTVLYLVFEE